MYTITYQINTFLFKSAKLFDEKYETKSENKGKVDDFEIVRVLGSGAFGTVVLAKHKEDEHYYAIKTLDKCNIVKLKQIPHVLAEKHILNCMDMHLLVKLHYHFKDNSYLYLVLDYIAGGEMFTHLRKVRKFPEKESKFYTAQVLLALTYLHHNNIVYRDLKPENILIDNSGYIKLTDFGFAKRIQGKTYSLCGTTDYFAPELIQNKPYGKEVDWWALGILMYEMTAGMPPFFSETPMQVYEKILAKRIKFPMYFSHEMKDLLRNMLQNDQNRRFGTMKNGVNDITQHKWFRDVNFDDIFNRKETPPYVPIVQSPSDTRNFSEARDAYLQVSTQDSYADEFIDF